MHITQVNTHDLEGGAAFVARKLFESIAEQGYRSSFVTGFKKLNNPDIHAIDPLLANNRWEELWYRLAKIEKVLPKDNIRLLTRKLCRRLARPDSTLRSIMGYEDFSYPRSHKLAHLTPTPPDLIHCHNLHGGYFDLNYIPQLSKEFPMMITLHDAWLLSGHCAHSLDCNKWQIGCGECPYLSIYPGLLADGTKKNWARKNNIYKHSKLYIATPSKWLMNKVEKSILMPSIIEKRVIPLGVNIDIFKPSIKQEARKKLGLPSDKYIALFVAHQAKKNIWKDFSTFHKAVEIYGNKKKDKVIFYVLGEEGEKERFGNVEIIYQPKTFDTMNVVKFYQSADIYIHSARVETFPLSILEALACGLPVIATDVGGISEQIFSLKTDFSSHSSNMCSEKLATGLLIKEKDTTAMASAINLLISDDTLREKIAKNTREDALRRFNQNEYISSYIDWYKEILKKKVA